MKQECHTCIKKYSYCHSCAIAKNIFKNAGYCDENCYRISMILQKYVGKAITALEAMKELALYNVDNVPLRPSVERLYQNIVNEARPKRRIKNIEEVIPAEDVEVIITDRDISTSE